MLYQRSLRTTYVCPIAHSNRCDCTGHCDEVFPIFARRLNDIIVGFEDTVRKPVGAHVLPDVFLWVQLWCPRWQKDQRHVWGAGSVCLWCAIRHDPAAEHRASLLRHGGIFLQDAAAWLGCRPASEQVLHLCQGPGKWHRRCRRWHYAGRRAGVALFRVSMVLQNCITLVE